MSIAQSNTRLFYWITLLASADFMEPIIALFYLHRGLTETEIFFTLTAYSASALLFEVPTGAFADRFGPKAAFMVGGAIQVLSRLLLLTVPDTWAIFLSNALWAIGWSFFSGADEALIYERVAPSAIPCSATCRMSTSPPAAAPPPSPSSPSWTRWLTWWWCR